MTINYLIKNYDIQSLIFMNKSIFERLVSQIRIPNENHKGEQINILMEK